MAAAKALSDGTRLRALFSLRGGELCVCQITELCGLAPSTMSRHMSVLKQAGLVESRKSGRWIYYRLADDTPSAVARDAIRWVKGSLAKDPEIARDAERLREILKLDPEVLCARQRRS